MFPHELEIHWLSILNSFVLVVLLTGFVVVILLRVLKADYARYTKSRETGDDTEDYGFFLFFFPLPSLECSFIFDPFPLFKKKSYPPPLPLSLRLETHPRRCLPYPQTNLSLVCPYRNRRSICCPFFCWSWDGFWGDHHPYSSWGISLYFYDYSLFFDFFDCRICVCVVVQGVGRWAMGMECCPSGDFVFCANECGCCDVEYYCFDLRDNSGSFFAYFDSFIVHLYFCWISFDGCRGDCGKEFGERV